MIFLLAYQLNAASIDFTQSTIISEGDNYENVNVYNDGSLIDMVGGTITDSIRLEDSSTLNMSGGTIGTVYNGNNATVCISNGTISKEINSEGTLLISGGIVDAWGFYINKGTTTITGGNISVDYTKFYSDAINIKGGNIDFGIVTGFGAVINIYGYDLICENEYDNFIISGYLLDGNPFEMTYSGGETEINLLPEPATLSLFGLGSIFLKRKYKM